MSSVTVDLNEIAPTAPEFEDAPPQRAKRPWVTWGAVGFLVIASAGAGWYLAGSQLTGEQDGDVPVVRADPSSIKSRPGDPGGMKVPDRDKLVYDRLQGRSSPTRAERMLAPPETPKSLPGMSTASGPTGLMTAPDSAAKTNTSPPPPPAAPGDAGVQVQPAVAISERPESLLPPKTTAAPVTAKLDRPPKTIAELVSATVQDETPDETETPPPAAAEKPQAVAKTAPLAPAEQTAELAKPAPPKAEPVRSEQTDPGKAEIAKADPKTEKSTETASAAAVPPSAAPTEKPAPETHVAAKTEPPKPAAPAPAEAPSSAPPSVAPAKAADGYRIQIAAVRSADAAEREWSRLQKKHTDLLGGLASMIEKADLGKKGVYYRIRAGMVADKAAAKDLCAALKQRKIGCIVMRRGS